MIRQGKAGMLAASAAAIGITGYSAWKLVGTGLLSWHVAQPQFHTMAAELLVVWLLLFLLFFYGKDDRLRLAGAVLITGAAAWLHVVFLPMLFAGLYAGYLTAVGYVVSRKVIRKDMGISWCFMLGTAVTVAIFCLLSLIGHGSIQKLRFWVVESGLLLAVWWGVGKYWGHGSRGGRFGGGRFRGYRFGGASGQRLRSTDAARYKHPFSAMTAWMLSAILMLLILQMGRMNGAVDFDSIWYGVRSDVMLNSGNGIYENLGTLGVVYTYPKGWETLTLPLAGLPSYSFPIAFNIWAAALVLFAAYDTARIRMGRGTALWVPFLMAAVPGIMNMGGTAKADMMTLFYQILMVQAMLRYEQDRDLGWLVMGLAAGGMSLTMKPTAVVFSTAIVGMGIIWLLWDCLTAGKRTSDGTVRRRAGYRRAGHRRAGSWREEHQSPWMCRELAAFGLAAAALAGIWGRTLLLVGVPVTSVFYQVFQKLGFQVKYPFYAAGFPSAANELSWMEKIRFFCGRLYGVLINPQGDDMGHVIIAWGTVIPLVLLILWLAGRLKNKGKEQQVPGYLQLLLPAVIVINLVSLYSLYQIDGNYYILFYFLAILSGCIGLEKSGGLDRKAVRTGLFSAWLYAVLICCLTNWAWVLGMGGLHPVNRGYYNHIEAEREKRMAQGSGAIWDILASNPLNRVIALGEHPGVLTFPCSVQSYVDVSGYWGNPEVVSAAPEFLRYLQYADIDYLYMEKEYVDTSVRIYQIVRTLVEEGWLTDVRDENGNLILTVEKEMADTKHTVQNLDVFDNRYIQHP